jgi:septum formation protein
MSSSGPMRVFLASQSPRRRELLKQIGVPHDLLLFRTVAKRGADIDETPLAAELPLACVERVCLAKAGYGWGVTVKRGLPRQPVLAADTVVCLGDEILGKPADAAAAEAMLARLAGRRHTVFTAVAVYFEDRVESRISRSAVTMRAIDADEIHAYAQTGEPLDKAGAYAIQGRAAAFISDLRGSYSGVMGLPLYETSELLNRFGFRIWP